MDVDLDSSPDYEDMTEEKSPGLKKKTVRKKRRKLLTEPQKPVSAYALFFRDTQAAIKAENSMATFGEISKIVASMWDSLSEEAKQVYKQKTETAKRNYIKQLAAYRAACASKDDMDEDDNTPLLSLKEKMTDKHSSPTLSVKPLPPPPKLQMAPLVIKKDLLVPKNDSITPDPSNGKSPSITPLTSSTGTSPIIPPPIQLRSIVPKAQGSITIIQGKPGQIIKLIPASQATTIPHNTDGTKSRILKMADLIRRDPSPPPQQGLVTEHNDVQPILQTLQQEHGVLLAGNTKPEQNGKKTNGIDNQTGEVIIIDEDDSPEESQLSEETPMEINNDYRTPNVRVCVRDGCPNLAVSDPQWNEEYCSAFCAVEHCRDVFDGWQSVRQVNASAS